MAAKNDRPLSEYLNLEYPFRVDADPDAGYVITFPDLPGCMTQVETTAEVGQAADEIRHLWIETEYEAGDEIPMPSEAAEYSGRFNLRLPRSLHGKLARLAEREGVSLNQCVVTLLSSAEEQAQRSRPARGAAEEWALDEEPLVRQLLRRLEARIRSSEQEDEECAHHWQIATPNAKNSVGVCKRCGISRAFPNYSQRKKMSRKVKLSRRPARGRSSETVDDRKA